MDCWRKRNRSRTSHWKLWSWSPLVMLRPQTAQGQEHGTAGCLGSAQRKSSSAQGIKHGKRRVQRQGPRGAGDPHSANKEPIKRNKVISSLGLDSHSPSEPAGRKLEVTGFGLCGVWRAGSRESPAHDRSGSEGLRGEHAQ